MLTPEEKMAGLPLSSMSSSSSLVVVLPAANDTTQVICEPSVLAMGPATLLQGSAGSMASPESGASKASSRESPPGSLEGSIPQPGSVPAL